MKFSFTFHFIFFNYRSLCTAQIRKEVIDEMISQRALDSIRKNTFGKMVAGTEDVTNLANYISFVPTDGKFTLSGNYFLQINKKDTAKKRKSEYFAVGFNSSGSIAGGTTASLFEDYCFFI